MQDELIPGIKSRPRYPLVSLNPHSRQQVFIVQQQAAAELQPLYERCTEGEKLWLPVVTSAVSAGDGAVSISELPQKLASVLMASSFYLAGTEAFMWDIAGILADAGFVHEQIQMLPPVSAERRVFCTHCYSVMEHVTHSPVTCTGCGRALLVRDHFSRIHSAYVGVQINAEDPADLPDTAEELS